MSEFEAGGHYLKDPSSEDVEPKEELPAPSTCVGDLDMGKVKSELTRAESSYCHGVQHPKLQD